MTQKTHNETFLKWIEFWNKKGSLFIQNADTLISPETILRNKKPTDEMKLNLFFSINGYKLWTKKRKAKNITKYNAFFFDIDLWADKHNNVSKEEAYATIESFADQFDFIVESNAGYHLYILLPDGRYTPDTQAEYLSDWKEKGLELETAIGLEFDKACYLQTQISRCCSSIHQKTPTQIPKTIKLLKGHEILFPLYETQKNINNIPITQVLEALDIEYENDKLYENGRLTNGRKINLSENYINDFTGKGRPTGNNFAFVKHWFMQNSKLDASKWETEAVIKTYWFFAEKFWIVQSLKKYKTIAIPQVLEKTLMDDNLNGKNIQTILALISYSRQYFQTQLPYGNKISAHLSDIIKTVWLSGNASHFASNLKELSTKLKSIGITTKKALLPILSFNITKMKNDRTIEYTLLPLWYGEKQSRRMFYWTHYINAKTLELGTKQEKTLKFYLRLCSELLSIGRLTDWEISKEELMKFFEDENFTRIKKKIEKIMTITWDFTITTTWKFMQFQKI